MAENLEDLSEGEQDPREVDSKYRLILIAAQRSKQLQRGAAPRVQFDANKHKPTRIALEEIKNGRVDFKVVEES